MNLDLTTVAIVGTVAVIPALVLWVHERRLRIVAEQRLLIARSVTGMEKLLLEGRFRSGDACHDFVFKLMSRVQGFRTFPRMNPFTRISDESEQFRDKLKLELQAVDSDAHVHIHAFVQAYYRALLGGRPIFGRLYSFCVGLQVVCRKLKRHRFKVVREPRVFVRLARPAIVQFVIAQSAFAAHPPIVSPSLVATVASRSVAGHTAPLSVRKH